MCRDLTGGWERKASPENNKARKKKPWIITGLTLATNPPLLGNEVLLLSSGLLPVSKWQKSQNKDRQPKFQPTLAHETFKIAAAKGDSETSLLHKDGGGGCNQAKVVFKISLLARPVLSTVVLGLPVIVRSSRKRFRIMTKGQTF